MKKYRAIAVCIVQAQGQDGIALRNCKSVGDVNAARTGLAAGAGVLPACPRESLLRQRNQLQLEFLDLAKCQVHSASEEILLLPTLLERDSADGVVG